MAIRLQPKFGENLQRCLIMGGNTEGKIMFYAQITLLKTIILDHLIY